MVKDQPDFATIYPEFEAFIKESTLLAHNASFDARFISAELARINKPLPENLILDSLKLFRKWYPELKSHKLGLMAKHLNIKGGTLHRATDDSFYLVDILNKSIKQINPRLTHEQLVEDSNGGIQFEPYDLTP